MSVEIHCPKCSSVNVVFSKKRNRHVCEDCQNEVTPAQPFVPKRLFISYGHDEHVPLALRLRDDLQKRGHDAWFDEECLKPGHDWEASIEKGLDHLAADKANAAVLLLLTPHSVRRPGGFCLNEVAHALSKGLRIIPLMVVESEPPLSICRIQWLDMRECIPIHEKEAFYAPRFERLLKAIEENRLDFEGTQGRLLNVLQPIQFFADILKLLRDFTGRKWVFDEVDAWLKNLFGSKIFWITGAPGVGKSAIAAWIRDNRREVAAFHFCDINSEEKRNPAKLVRSVVYQLSTQLPEYQERLARLPLEEMVREYHEAYTLFDKLLIQPLADNFPKPDRTVVVLMDALDEATYQRQNEIVRFLSLCVDKTPPWLRFLVTSRPEPEIVASFRKLSPYVLDTAKAENIRDLRTFLQAQLPGITREQTAAIIERSEGVFLYVRHVVEAVQAGQLSLQRLDEFPRGLGDVYQQFFQRQFGADLPGYEEKITPLLQPILAAFEPLTLGLLKGLCGIASDTELGRRLNRLGSLFPTGGEGDSAPVRPFHRSLCDWITDRHASGHYHIAAADGHRMLAERGWQQFERGPETMESYFLQWLPSHLLALGDDQRLVRLLKDFRYLMEKCRRDMIERLLADYCDLPARLTNAGTGLELEAAFFREKAHILRRGNDEWPVRKILLQIAVEHADDSPLTRGAEKWLAEGCCDWLWLRRVQRLSHVQNNSCLATLEGHMGLVYGAMVLSDGRLLSWAGDGTLRLWDDHSGACLATLKGHTDGVRGALALSGGRMLSWADDSTLRMWDGHSGACLATMQGHSDGVWGALVLSDGRLLSWAGDGTLRLWDDHSGTCLATLKGHTDGVRGALALSGGRLLSWSRDHTLRLWDGHSGVCLATLQGHTDRVRGALVLSDGRLLSWAEDGTLRLWDDHSGACLNTLEGHTDRVRGALVLSNGQLLSWSRDHTLRLWDGHSGACLATMQGHSDEVWGALVLSNGQLLSWSRDHTLRLWDGRSGVCLATMEGHTEWVWGALMLNDRRLLSWSWDHTLRLWDSHSGVCLATLQGHSDGVRGALALSDGLLLSWAEDGTLRLWNGHGSDCLKTIEGHEDRVWGALALSDGRLLSWAGLGDSTLRLWDGYSGACLAILQGHTEWVVGALALSDGRLLSWTGDGTLRLWDGRSSACLATLKGHADGVQGALVLENGQLLSWSIDRTLRLWDGHSGICLEVVPEDEVAKCHPEWLYARARAYGSKRASIGFSLYSSARVAQFRHQTSPVLVAAWNADSDADARCVLPDGTAVVTQANGQVCILKLHHGQRRVTLAETEVLLPQLQPKL